MAYPEFTTEELATEEWREVAGHGSVRVNQEVSYYVSDLGRVMSVTIKHLKPGKVSAGSKNPRSRNYNDYTRVSLNTNGRQKGVSIHGLVAKAFIGQAPPGKPVVNHDDGRKFNNRLRNLEYTSHQGNSQHARDTGLYRQGEASPAAKLTDSQVTTIIQRLANGESGQSIWRDFPVTQRIISQIRRNAIWKHLPRPESLYLGALPYAGPPQGSDSPDTKLTEDDIRAIRETYATKKLLLQGLADMYSISKSTVARIVKRQTWKHVT